MWQRALSGGSAPQKVIKRIGNVATGSANKTIKQLLDELAPYACSQEAIDNATSLFIRSGGTGYIPAINVSSNVTEFATTYITGAGLFSSFKYSIQNGTSHFKYCSNGTTVTDGSSSASTGYSLEIVYETYE